jgi:hypothetical protein
MRQVTDALVDEASEGSFPASDPPSYWARTSAEIKAGPDTDVDEHVSNERRGIAEDDVKDLDQSGRSGTESP